MGRGREGGAEVGIGVGVADHTFVLLNFTHTIIAHTQRTNVVDVTSSMWGDVLLTTGQPDFAADLYDSCDVFSDTTQGGCTVDIGR